MKITLGEWKTRCGQKAIVAAVNDGAAESQRVIGWAGEFSQCWYTDGRWSSTGRESGLDLIAPWTEPVPWDWSTTPPWINWIALSSNGFWWMYSEEPTQDANGWIGYGECAALIPQSYHPQWSGDWKLSKTQRPKEASK